MLSLKTKDSKKSLQVGSDSWQGNSCSSQTEYRVKNFANRMFENWLAESSIDLIQF